MNKNLKNFGRFIRIKIKRSTYNNEVIKKFREKSHRRKNERNKKLFNFILADDFIKEFKTGRKIENVEGFYIHLYEFKDAYLSCCANCAFVQKTVNNKTYSFKESAGIIKRLDEPTMNYAKPFDLNTANRVEEDEVCLLCFLQSENYWHYTFEIVPRLMIMLQRGYKGKFLVSDTFAAKQFTELLSIPEDRLLYNNLKNYGTVIHAKKVFMFSEMYGIELHGGLLAATRAYLIEEAENKFGPLEDKKSPKRIYISRISRRKIKNEAQIIGYLKANGFEIIVPEKLSVHDQMKLFYNADIIVTGHGANSTNLLYSKAHTSFVECFGHMWINHCMIHTIDMLNIDYHMLCERLADYDENANKFSDYAIHPLLFECTIRKILKTREKLAQLKKIESTNNPR